jgi:biotin operon repressor
VTNRTVNVDRQTAEADARTAAYIVGNGYLALQAILAKNIEMPPTKLLLYVTILVAAVQKVMRSGELPEPLRGTAVLPIELTGFISRRGLASATGVSRETVRRYVSEMLDEGLLITGTRGRVAAQPGILAQPHIQNCLYAMLREFAAISERLHRLGVLQIADNAPCQQPAPTALEN